MISLLTSNPLMFFLVGALLLFSIAVHEFSHALMADKLGDPTPRARGRLSLNPLVHIDLVGLFFILFWGFGWGKPVPYDPFNLNDPDKDGAKIAFAGPLSSFLLAITASLLMRIIPLVFISNILGYLVYLNVYLGLFNLVPIYPLDGFQVLAGILPAEQRAEWLGLKRYGMIILLVLLLPIFSQESPLITILKPLVNLILGLLLPGGNIL